MMNHLLPFLIFFSASTLLSAAEDTVRRDFTAPQLPVVELTLNGRQTNVEMEDLRNPLMLIQTTRGDLVVELFPDEAPLTVANFVDLAEGNKAFTDPLSGQEVQRPFYDGLSFHRVVRDFIVQGGSADNTPYGSPGYSLKQEINAIQLGLNQMSVLDSDGFPNPLLGIRNQQDFQEKILKPLYQDMAIESEAGLTARIDEVDERLRAMSVQQLYELYGYEYTHRFQSRAPVKGMIAMASNGTASNGSQFFFTLNDALWLSGKHTVFGKVRGGMTVLETISQMPVDAENHPLQEVTILLIRRIRV